MFIGGLWHGASWTFVVWGLLHGLYLVFERVLTAVTKEPHWARGFLGRLFIVLGTYAAVCFAWVFFRATTFTTAAHLIGAMAGMGPKGDAILSSREILQVGLVTAGLMTAHWNLRDTSIEAVVAKMPRGLVIALWTLMLSAIILTQGNGNAFIYFQF
jgi:D-alanyl-lipoteichoic acid acyltransferase DltB (MBOAT superfamily)